MNRALNGWLAVLGTMLIAAFGVGVDLQAAGADKVKICHIPPGNPENFHTITISQDAKESHLAHGDSEYPCDANCELLCDDQDACTVDVASEPGSPCFCIGGTRPEVNCDDGDICTQELGCSEGVCQYQINEFASCPYYDEEGVYRQDIPGYCSSEGAEAFCGREEECDANQNEDCGFKIIR